MKFSTGNQIKGKIMEIRKGGVTAIVYVAVPGDTTLEVSVTIPALETLELYEGKPVVLMINPGDIIIGCEYGGARIPCPEFIRPMDTIVKSAPDNPEDRTSRAFRLPDGRMLSYAEFGDSRGLPVIAIHGTPGSRFMFALTDAAARERGLRIVAPDRPGYGHSDYRRNQSLMRSAEDFVALADALNTERLAVIGVSGGGPHAVATAWAMPDRVALLALVSPVGPVAECRKQVRMSRLHRLIFTRMGRSPQACASFFWSLRGMVRWAPGVAYRVLQQRVPPTDRSVLCRSEVETNLRAAIKEGLRPGIKGALQDLRLFCSPWGLPLAEIDVPAVVWQGSDDTIVPPSVAYHLATKLPNCRLDVIQKAGHYWGFANFPYVLDAVRAALDR